MLIHILYLQSPIRSTKKRVDWWKFTLSSENASLRIELESVRENLHTLKVEFREHEDQSEVYFDQIYDLERWREVQEERRVNRVSSPIDLTGDSDSDSEDEVVEIPGFPTEIPMMLVPLEEAPTSGEVCTFSL